MNLVYEKFALPFIGGAVVGFIHKWHRTYAKKLEEIVTLQGDLITWVPGGYNNANTPDEFAIEFQERNDFLRMAMVHIAESDHRIRIYDKEENRLDR